MAKEKSNVKRQDLLHLDTDKSKVWITLRHTPVSSLNWIRVFLALCCHRGYHIQQYDVDTVFLNGALEEDVFI